MVKKLKALRGKKKAMYEALKSQLGIVTSACKLVGISRQTHYRWLREDENYKAWIEQIPDITLDFAETALLKQIKEGNTTAIIFYLKTKGKQRGYIERQEIDTKITSSNITVDDFYQAYEELRKEKDTERTD